MYLKSLEISGFKSFAKKTNLDFKTPITAIVGPNGSGKSNIAEAFRFVLGEQSLKSMRGKRGEDLIWNGGNGTTGRSNRASVKITFDNSKRQIGIDFDEVALERAVYRDSLSEYFINGTLVRLKDISETLAGAHVGSSGHHIISQGEADRILSANSKERREIIEDALGLKIYQYKKRESERKLQKTDENIKQVESLRREIAPHIKFLKKQVEKVEKTKQMKDELTSVYKEYLLKEKIHIENQNRYLDDELKGPEQKLIEIEKKIIEAKKAISDSPIIDSKRKKLLEVESDLGFTRQERDRITREVGRIEGEITGLRRLIEKAKKDSEAEETATILVKEVRDLVARIKQVARELEGVNDFESVKQISSRIIEITDSFSGKISNSNSLKTESFEKDIEELIKAKNQLDEKITETVSRESNLYSSYEEIKNDIEKEKDKTRDAERELFSLMSEQKDLYGIIASLKEKKVKLLVLKDEFEREIREGFSLIGRAVYLFDEEWKQMTRESISNFVQEERVKQDERLRDIQKLKIRIEDAGAGGGEDVMKEFKEVSEREEFLAKEIADLEVSSNSLRQLIEELDSKLEEEFKMGIEKINFQFNEFFCLMFGGGKASIKVIVDEQFAKQGEDFEIEEGLISNEKDKEKPELGIEIDVKLPRKNIKGLEMLSGGERALTSIALLFAISQVNPPPFIILDETDAALDEANSRKYGDMIENLSKLSQLILITHNRETMSRAGVLYGITMGQDGVSKLLSIEFEEAVAVAK
jgi:chromosome segregation protein